MEGASNEAVKVFSLAPHPPLPPLPLSLSPPPSHIKISLTNSILISSHWFSFSRFFPLLILLINTVQSELEKSALCDVTKGTGPSLIDRLLCFYPRSTISYTSISNSLTH